jgi:hypothetical protein
MLLIHLEQVVVGAENDRGVPYFFAVIIGQCLDPLSDCFAVGTPEAMVGIVKR